MNAMSLEELRFKREFLEPLHIYRGHVSGVSSACLIKDKMITGDVHGKVIVFDVKFQRIKAQFDLMTGVLNIINVNNDCLIHCRDGSLVLLKDDTPMPLNFRFGEFSFCKCSFIHRGDTTFLVGPHKEDPESLCILNYQSLAPLNFSIKPKDKAGACMCSRICFDGDERLILFAGFDDGTIRIYIVDIPNDDYKEIDRLKIFPMTITCMDYDKDSDSLVVGGPQQDLVLIRQALSPKRELIRNKLHNEGLSEVCFSSTGKIIITGGWDGKIRFFSVDNFSMLALSNVHSDTILSLSAFYVEEGFPHPRRPIDYNHLLIATSLDRTLTLWSIDHFQK